MFQRKFLILIAFSSLIVVLDQWVKIYIHTRFFLGESVEIIPYFFDLTYVRNTGAAFGVFQDSHKIIRTVFLFSMPPLALILVIALLRNIKDEEIVLILALSGISGGAIGNFIDRLRFGFVIDFLDFYIGRHHWPAFNIADIGIVTGMGTLFLILYKDSFSQKKSISPKKKGETQKSTLK